MTGNPVPQGRVPIVSYAEYQMDRFLCLARCADDEALVAAQDGQPVLNVGSAVAEAANRFQSRVMNQSRCAYLRDQFFLAVFLRAEMRRVVYAVQALAVPGGMRQLVEDGAVVFSGADELLHLWNRDAVGQRLIERSVSCAVME